MKNIKNWVLSPTPPTSTDVGWIKPEDGEYRLYVRSGGKFIPINSNTPKATLTYSNRKGYGGDNVVNGKKVLPNEDRLYTFENVESFSLYSPWSVKLTSTGGAVPLKNFQIYLCDNIELGDIDTSQITSMEYAFKNCTLPKGISTWNLENNESLEGTFANAKADYDLYLPYWVTAKTKSLKKAFYRADIKLDGFCTQYWNITSVEDWESAFEGFKGTELYFFIDTPFNLENGVNMENAFRDSALKKVGVDKNRLGQNFPIRNARYAFANSKCTSSVFHFFCDFLDGCDITGMYYNCPKNSFTFGTGTSKIGAMDYAFAESTSMSSFTISTGLDTENCVSMLGIFRNCSSLVNVIFPSTGFSLEGVKTADGLTDMFKGCYKLKDITFSSNSGTWSNATLDLSDCNKNGNYELSYNTYDSMLKWPTRTGDLASSPAYIAFNSASNVSSISTFTDTMTAKGFTIVLK